MRVNKKNLRNIGAITAITIAVIVGAAFVTAQFRLFINTSSSHVPVGLWRKIADTDDRPLQVGDIVVFSLAELYEAKPEVTDNNMAAAVNFLIKKVAAVAGDSITLENNRVAVNGVLFNNAEVNHKYISGDIRCKIQYPLKVPEGHVWLMANVKDSFDSRYFGAVPVSQIKNRAKAVLLWK